MKPPRIKLKGGWAGVTLNRMLRSLDSEESYPLREWGVLRGPSPLIKSLRVEWEVTINGLLN